VATAYEQKQLIRCWGTLYVKCCPRNRPPKSSGNVASKKFATALNTNNTGTEHIMQYTHKNGKVPYIITFKVPDYLQK